MSNGRVALLRCYADIKVAVFHPWIYAETADFIEAQDARIAELKALAYGLMIAMSASGDDFADILKEARAVLGGKDEDL